MEEVISELRESITHKVPKIGSNSLTEKDYALLRGYVNSLNESELRAFDELLDRFHHRFKYYGLRKYKISSAAIKLATKIAKETPFRVYPWIERIARKSWDVSSGTYSFGMYLIDDGFTLGKMLHSNEPSSNFLKASNYIDYGVNFFGDTEISAEKREANGA